MSDRAKSPTRFTKSGESPSVWISFKIALPITAASANCQTCRTCSALAAPKPPASVLLERIEQQLHNGKKGVTKWWKVGKSGKK
jgi:hypothetical protein